MGAQQGWEGFLGRYGVETVLLPPDAPLTGALRQSSAWRLIYSDTGALIFRLARAREVPEQLSAVRAGARSAAGIPSRAPLLYPVSIR